MGTAPTLTRDDPTTPAPLDPDHPVWLTATVRPAGLLDRRDSGRLRALLDALSACASVVVLDLEAAHLRGRTTAGVIDDAASVLESRGGCLVCIHADQDDRRCLTAAGNHAVFVDTA